MTMAGPGDRDRRRAGGASSWVGAAALAVLSSAVVAALALPATAGPRGAVKSEVSAATAVAPTSLVLRFPPAARPSASATPRAPRTATATPSRAPASRPLASRTPPAPASGATGTRAAAPADALCSGAGWERRRGELALASLRRPGDAQSFRVDFLPGRSDVLGLAYLGERRVEVFVRSCAELSDSLLRHVVAHELGHLIDAAMPSGRREEWLAARGIAPGTPWLGCNGCADFATPAGDFAEVYAQWQRSAADNLSELGSAPSSVELDRLAARFF